MTDESDDIKISTRATDQAQTLMELGRYEQAIPLLSKAIAKEPDDDWLHCRIADAYFYLGDHDKSLSHAKRALHLNPNSDHAHYRLAWNHLQTNHFDGALKHAKAAIKIDPDDGANLYTLAWSEYHSGHINQAMIAAMRAIELSPDDAGLHELIADLSFNSEKYKQAEKHYREALRHNPESASIHCNLGLCLAEQHKVHEAADHLLVAVKIDPSNERYRNSLFNIVHHELMALPVNSRQAVLKQLGPNVNNFYQDQLIRKGWFEKLRMTSMVTLWLFILTLMMLFFTWVTGEDIKKLSEFVVVVGGIYFILFLMRTVMNLIRIRKHKKYYKK